MRLKMFLLVAVLSVFLASSVKVREDLFEITKQIEIYADFFETLTTHYVDDLNPKRLSENGIKDILQTLDPYTSFYSEQTILNAQIYNEVNGSDIGAKFQFIYKKLMVKRVDKDSSADRNGLKIGDEIKSIDGLRTDEFGHTILELLVGVPGSSIQLEVFRDGKTKTINATRENAVFNAVPHYTILDNGIGYIALTEFTNMASEEVKMAYDILVKEGMTSLIFDLRDNPGGLLDQAVKIVNMFVKKGELVVSTKGKNEENTAYYTTTKNPIDTNIPIAIIVNGSSASASEIVSGAIQDLDRGVILGTRSFGKGLVQRYFNLKYGNQLKITISRYHTPSGRCIQAIDYSQSNTHDKRPDVLQSEHSEFKTRNGRPVFDGGGILPDIVMQKEESREIIALLKHKNYIFNFVNKHASKYLGELGKITIAPADWNVFKSSVALDTTLNKDLERKLFELMDHEHLSNSFIRNALDDWNSRFKLYQQNMLDKYVEDIKQEIVDEIVVRRSYLEGLSEYHLKYDKTIDRAKEILANPQKYNKILGR